MDGFFQVINDILFFKKEQNITEDELQFFVPSIINRYASMYSPEMCEYIEATTNNKNILTGLEPMELHDLYYAIIPKLRYKKIKYIKKIKKEQISKEKNDELQLKLKMIAKNMDLSFKEVYNLYNFYNNTYGQTRTK